MTVNDLEDSNQQPPREEGKKHKDRRVADNQDEEVYKPTKYNEDLGPEEIAQDDLVAKSSPSTPLEIALYAVLKRKEIHVQRLTNEVFKLNRFVKKRKQTYKRKRKEDGAPVRALSAYNIFIQDRFAQLKKENDQALKSEAADAELKRVPPANLVAATGNEWKDLPDEVKAQYEERAKSDRKRYEEEMAAYQPPDKQANRKRNKTGYNMFFSAHVLRLKQTDSGVPSERGSVARIVGTAWKQLSSEEKQYYEREADKHNGLHPVKEVEEEVEDEEEVKRQMEHYHNMQMHDMQMQQQQPMHDPRHYYPPPHMYGQPYGHYDYSQHHRHQQARAQGYNQGYAPQPRHPYDGGQM